MDFDTRVYALSHDLAPFICADCDGEYAFSTPPHVRNGASDVFDEAFDGDHDIEYWLWNGARLVPAAPDEVERLQTHEAQILQNVRQANELRLRTSQQSPSGVNRLAKALHGAYERLQAITGLFHPHAAHGSGGLDGRI